MKGMSGLILPVDQLLSLKYLSLYKKHAVKIVAKGFPI